MRCWMLGLAATLLAASSPGATARDFPFKDEVTAREVTLPLKDATLDDSLLAWAQAGGLNVLVDATHLRDGQPKITGQRQGTLGRLILAIAAQNKVGGRRYDADTFLMWGLKPEHVATARLIIARELRLDAEAPPPLSIEQLQVLLSKYFRDAHGWDGKTDKVDIRVKVADLPPELRARILTQVRHQILEEERWCFVWFSDDLWNKARLHLQLNVLPGGRPDLCVAAAVEEDVRGEKTLLYASRALISPFRMGAGGEMQRKVYQTPFPPQPVKPVFDDTLDQPEQPGAVVPMMSAGDLKSDPALSASISTQAKRLPLSGLLLELQKQGAVSLAAAPDAPQATITARIEKMPLWNVMGALSRLYGVEWHKSAANSYTMHAGRDKLATLLTRISQMETFPVMSTPENRVKARATNQEAAARIWDSTDIEAASTDAGLLLSQLEPEARLALRQRYEGKMATDMTRSYQAVQEKLGEDLELHFRTWPPRNGRRARRRMPRKQPAEAPLVEEAPSPTTRLSVHLPEDSPYRLPVPPAVWPDPTQRLLASTMLAGVFPSFPSGRDQNPFSNENIKRQMELALQREQEKARQQVPQPQQAPQPQPAP